MSDRKIDQAPAQSPIAIVGMSCLFPGASSLREYWANVRDGRVLRQEVPIGGVKPTFRTIRSAIIHDRVTCSLFENANEMRATCSMSIDRRAARPVVVNNVRLRDDERIHMPLT